MISLPLESNVLGTQARTDAPSSTGSQATVHEVLVPGGTLLLLQSVLCGVDKTEAILEEHGMAVEISARKYVPFGPVMRERRTMLEARGLITTGQEIEQLVIIRATKSCPSPNSM